MAEDGVLEVEMRQRAIRDEAGNGILTDLYSETVDGKPNESHVELTIDCCSCSCPCWPCSTSPVNRASTAPRTRR